MRYLSTIILLMCIILWSSCRKDFDSDPSTGNLQFSTDTLFLDTIFTNIGSSTYNFKVYNRTDDDFTIPSISLERGESSSYRLNVDGISGKSFENIQVLANDSIFVFVETTTDITQQTADTEFLYTDRILFDPAGAQQDVDLVTLVQDAVFLFPSRNDQGMVEMLTLGTDENGDPIEVEGFFLDDNELTFTNEKPYVIYGRAAIPPDKTLTIEAGARIHFHAESGIIAAENANLLVNGALSTDPETLENEVIFEGDRLEPGFSDVPGQWIGIILASESTATIQHATIKNAQTAINVQPLTEETAGPALTITNTQIYNHSLYGILSIGGNVLGENVVINNCGISSLRGTLGGTYNFNHCTFANYWNSNFRETPSVLIENFLISNTEITVSNLIEANFENCIIYGNEDIEIILNKAPTDEVTFNYNFKNSLIRFNDVNEQFSDNELYDFTNTSIYQSILLNEDPDFKTPFDNILNIGEDSAANGQASTPTSGTDILGTLRNASAPDMGAYESITFEMEEN